MNQDTYILCHAVHSTPSPELSGIQLAGQQAGFTLTSASLDTIAAGEGPPRLDALVLASDPAALLQDGALGRLLEAHPELPILVAASSCTVAAAVGLMQQGAADLLESSGPVQPDDARLSRFLSQTAASTPVRRWRLELRERLAKLTPAEVSVLDAMLTGLANKQIAQQLGIGLRTVELRRSKIMRKMVAKSAAELVRLVVVARSLDEGLVPYPSDGAKGADSPAGEPAPASTPAY
ncbi:Tetrathionate response regulatory protein TtrR [Pseudobythopirellula maris]|uniref:Tetrathionate response regulatory protein TtrR n=1 Tax=Pseudobythopirellula maris TaxID=2527991 RepID=A0A5C5ZVG5_9BACT|nr:LuxR C-terminal-related transcriptional regulator [Pseudobythopirellula maris]TWT91115.1 Tetrathionate response regulatory protein TtrR [Pseudobythopirellula maris]